MKSPLEKMEKQHSEKTFFFPLDQKLFSKIVPGTITFNQLMVKDFQYFPPIEKILFRGSQVCQGMYLKILVIILSSSLMA